MVSKSNSTRDIVVGLHPWKLQQGEAEERAENATSVADVPRKRIAKQHHSARIESLHETSKSCTAAHPVGKRVRLSHAFAKLTTFLSSASYRAGTTDRQPSAAAGQLYEYVEPQLTPSPQRQQLNPASTSHPHRSQSATASTSARSLRRTPRLRERRNTLFRRSSHVRLDQPAADTGVPAQEHIAFTRTGSTTPQSFQKLVQDDTFWPKRQTRISRRTHEAILYALEAVRTGRGVDAKQLTADSLEESARMSDLYMQDPQGQAIATTRPQDVARTQAEAARIATPRDIMAARHAREARKAQQDSQYRQDQDTDPSRRRPRPEDVVGVAPDPRRQQIQPQSQSHPQPSRIAYSDAEAASRIPAGQSVTIGGRSDVIPTSNGIVPRTGTTLNQGQPRPVPAQQTYQNPGASQLQPGFIPGGDTSRIQRNRTEAYERLDMPAVAGAKPSQPQDQNFSQPSTSNQTVRAGFPHAFERWETLSSHWEGLTSYWIRKLQENTNELDSKPIDKQMARQITDLSAAGANLFHAVVELQRLRASSERKFQRWFFETRNEQEQAQEKIAELQAALQQEKQKQPQISNASVDAIQAEKNKADELVREMRRELQISKDEARRAWEELGRREQEERERTIALRSGEPTLIGGVQVLPMQGLSSRHNTASSNRPVTRDGPYPGGPTATTIGGQALASRSQTTLESPTQEHEQFTYQPETTSPTDTDPFTEVVRTQEPPIPLRHEPDTRFVSTGSPAARQPTATQDRARIVSPTHSQRSAIGQHSEGPSYIASPGPGSQSEEEYHIGPDGQIIRDDRGRPIPYRQPMGGYEDVDSDDDNNSAAVEAERRMAEQFAQRQAALGRGSPARPNVPVSSRSPQQLPQSAYAATTTPQMQSSAFPQGDSPADSRHITSSTISPVTPQQAMTGRLTSPLRDPADYDGAGYGEPDPSYPPPTTAPGGTAGYTTATHHVPTRLSDILEERTEPSRSSALSATPTTHSDTQGGVFGTRR